MELIKVFSDILGIFDLQKVKPLPTPAGIEIENEGDDIVYIGSNVDKWLMYGDRLRISDSLNIAIKEAKNEHARKCCLHIKWPDGAKEACATTANSLSPAPYNRRSTELQNI